jgi:hypothetical protein
MKMIPVCFWELADTHIDSIYFSLGQKGNSTVRKYFLIIIGVLILCINVSNVDALEPALPSIKQVDEPMESAEDAEDIVQTNQSTDLEPIGEKKIYRVGVSYVNGYPLFSFADLEDRGFGWAVLEKFAEANNIEFQYTAMPITRLQPSMDSGAIDFIFPDNPRWTLYRSNRIPNIFSGAVISAISVTFVRQENYDMALNKVKKVAIPFGHTAYTWLDPIQKYNIKSMPVRDLNTALYSVVQRTADAADIEYNIGQYLIAKNPSLAYLTINPNLPNVNVDYHLSSIKHIRILEKLTTFVKEEHLLIERLRKQYGIKYHHEVLGNPQHFK